MKYFDLHCDTLLACYDKNLPLNSNDLHISLDRAAVYDEYRQVLGIFSRPALSDDAAYENCLKVIEYYHTLDVTPNFSAILAVECGKLLGGRLERVDELYRLGVRFMTMVWGSYTCIGGAHNDGRGYTDFGLAALRRCFEVGIVPDMSHASDTLFYETVEVAKSLSKPIVCTHSNSRAVCNHTRNLTDEMFREVVELGGVVGVSMVRSHLTSGEVCGLPEIVRHIEHYMSLGGDATVALGCDLDGTNPLPDGLGGVGDIVKIADELARLGYTQTQIDNIFHNNVYNFMVRNGIF